MRHHSNAGDEPTPRRANTPPPAGNVHGLGLVDALRVDVEPAQLPWLAGQIDVVRYCLEDELAHHRAGDEEPPAAAKEHRRSRAAKDERELDRRAYQLEVLAMIRAQLPISDEGAATAIAGPWRGRADDAAPAPALADGPVVVVGPAALMTVLMRGAARDAADALGAALHGPGLDVDEHTDSGAGWRGPELPRVTPAIAEQLRAIAGAAHAFTDTYLHILAQQTYSFDPGHQPVSADELA